MMLSRTIVNWQHRFANPSFRLAFIRSIGWRIAMAGFGRLLQIAGLIVPPVSILLQLQGTISLGQMLTMLVAAVSAFWIGRILEGYARQ
jgi:hypothetical protein